MTATSDQPRPWQWQGPAPAGPPVHARCGILADPQVCLIQPTQIDVVVQRSESHLRRLLRQLCYLLLFR